MTTRIEDRFRALKEEGRPAFVTFVMAGDPDHETALEIARALPAAGADIIELVEDEIARQAGGGNG